ncbi:MAG: hypothetical protein R2745_11930 [Vicinamibacterales bacterium]
MQGLRRLLLTGAALMLGAAHADAQTIGTFRWQLQPYCNVLTVTVVQQGAQYQIDGSDDLCGAPRVASVVGRAFQNPDGTIGFGLTTVTTAGATPIHIDARISLGSLSGPWTDSAGNSGTFAFTQGAGTGGAVRPVPGGMYYQPHMGEYFADDTSWGLFNGWTHTAGSTACLYAPVHVPAGTSVTGVALNYIAAGAITVNVAVLGQRTTAGSGASSQRALRNLYDANRSLASTGGAVVATTIVDDAADSFLGLPKTPVGGQDYDTVVGVCTAGALTVAAVRVNVQ